MAIEIKEIVIRAVVDYPSSGEPKSEAAANQSDDAERDQSAIIDACVKQVLKIIERKQNR